MAGGAVAHHSVHSGQALDVPDNRRVFVAGQAARPVAEGVSRVLALPVLLRYASQGCIVALANALNVEVMMPDTNREQCRC